MDNMHINLSLSGIGFHAGAWRHPYIQLDRIFDYRHFQRLVMKAEAAKLDSILIPEKILLMKDTNDIGKLQPYEPFTLLTTLAGVSKRIGLIGTISASYYEPYHVASSLTSLNHISKGRVGLNLKMDANDGFERLEEFMDVMNQLWNSWNQDVIVLDRNRGILGDWEKAHVINHKGKYFSVEAMLPTFQSSILNPIIACSDPFDSGREFAARYADMICTNQQSFEVAQDFYKYIKNEVDKNNRNPEQVKIIANISPVIGRTEDEAQEKIEKLHQLILDSGELKSSDHPAKIMVGTSLQIADQLEEWFLGSAADGFNIMPNVIFGDAEAFVDTVMPILQERGLFRTEYGCGINT